MIKINIEQKIISKILTHLCLLKKQFVILIMVLALILELYLPLSLNKKVIVKYNHKKIIFTFWEPHDKIPGYISLCIKTWKKFFPDYEIKILDYKSLKDYIPEELFFNIIDKNMSLAMQADAIRVALLKLYGGLWMDTDNIIINGNLIKMMLNYELSMIGEEKYKIQYIGFIFASQNSSILESWLKKIIYNVKTYRNILKNDNKSLKKKLFRGNYLGNAIIDPILKNISNKKYLRLDSNKINCFPERVGVKHTFKDNEFLYKNFYFQKGDPQTILNNTKFIILLHNSWTPSKYKKMSENEFLKQDIRLSRLLSKVLNDK